MEVEAESVAKVPVMMVILKIAQVMVIAVQILGLVMALRIVKIRRMAVI